MVILATFNLIIILLFFLIIPLSLIYVIIVYPYNTWIYFRDQTLLRYLSVNSQIRPNTVVEAIERLHKFKVESVRIQYLHALRNWLSVTSEWQLFIEEARKHKGVVRDELYKLFEIWQDLEMGKS